MNKPLRIVFMGTPEFAVASLDALVNAGFDIAAVVTAPDKPAGRGLKIQQSAVKQYATEKGLKVLQPEKLKSPEFISELRELYADVHAVVAFRMLPEVVWNMPLMGTINVHASLLPRYRGAAPINWAIINGEVETGVTTFRLKHEIDTGNILLQEKTEIGRHETAGELHDRLKVMGGKLLVETMRGLQEGTLEEKPQSEFGDELRIVHAPKIFTETCRINWDDTADEIYNLIRGLSPYPGAFTTVNGKILKIFRAGLNHSSQHLTPGTMETDSKTYLRFATRTEYMDVIELQLEGKKRMLVEDFLRGHRLV